jgi:hypothetical protein
MLGLPLAFAAPAVLAALVGLVALYWVLRVTPPRPRRQVFPPVRLLLGLDPKETTAHRTPWPILLLRLAVAGLVIFAMAGPVLRALRGGGAKGPLLILLDDGWAAAPAWEKRIALAREQAEAAAKAGRPVALAALSRGGQEIALADGESVEAKLAALTPAPYAPPRAPARAAVTNFLAAHGDAQVLWIADGLDFGGGDAFADVLKGASAEVAADAATPLALTSAESLPDALEATVARAGDSGPGHGVVRALDAKGRSVGEAAFDFADKSEAKARFEMPVEVRNDIVRLVIDGERSAGAVWLLDERARRRRVATVGGGAADLAEPLLASTYYVTRALTPFAEVREARAGVVDPIADLLTEQPSALVLADTRIAPADHDKIVAFVEAGGVLIRFAGARTASADDDLMPVELRRGDRTLGGALSWDSPKHIAPFEAPSPFVGLKIPEEVTVSRQVLAEPNPGLPEKTWARLADGTPLVTATRRGKGRIVLFHVTADTTWSNLPLSGLFVEMLRRIVAEAGAPVKAAGASAKAAGAPLSKTALAPWRTLDGFGALGEPPATAKPLTAEPGVADAEHPPGFYGAPDSASALNAMSDGTKLTATNYGGLKLRSDGLTTAPPVELKPWLLLAAFVGFLIDTLASLGKGGRRWRFARAAPLALLLLIPPAPPARAGELTNVQAATATRLAYVVTGDAETDETSRLGLDQLSRALNQRTSAALADPVGVDPAKDELSFYPWLYWPIAANQPQPAADAVARVAAFMHNGGTIVFDTRDALEPEGASSAASLWLRKLMTGVDVPALEPAPRDHVVTKTFYLLDKFVGRYDNGQTWIEALPPADPNDRTSRPARAGDSVSPIVITSNDLAGAWAARDDGTPLYALTPGGPRQREMALRAGVNLVMYALTGNYKADQVHARDLLERLAR